MRKQKPGCLSMIIILLILILFGFSILGKWDIAQKAEKPNNDAEIYSTHAILVDLSRNRILYEKASLEKTYPASLTKIMTAIVAIENIPDLEKKILLLESMFNNLYKDASMAGFLPNEKVKAIDLLYATMLPSGAEAANGLALSIAGSEKEFVKLMNQKAEALGMKDTHFVNASGLHDPKHYTTVYDMALLLKYALRNDTFRQIFEAESYTTSKTNLHPDGISFYSIMYQKLGSAEFNGGKILGGKTGYTDMAGLCLASLARKNGREYMLITTGAPGNHDTEQYNIKDAFYVYSNFLS